MITFAFSTIRTHAATAMLVVCTTIAGCNAAPANNENPAAAAPPANNRPDTTKPMSDSGITTLQITDVTPGTGAEARPGMTVSVHYTGWLYDAAAADKKGSKFDSSKDRNEPFEFPLGAGQVIEGWDRGVAGMKTGGSRVLTIPPALGYGARGAGGDIPPNATLLFEVELVGVR